MSKRLVHFVYV